MYGQEEIDAAVAAIKDSMDVSKAGLLTVFSFHTQKNMTTLGEGGMITTDDDSVERMRKM